MCLPVLLSNYAFKPALRFRFICVFLIAGSCVVEQELQNAREKSIVAEQAAEVDIAVATRDRTGFEKSIEPLLVSACYECHSGESVEGNFHADKLDPDLSRGSDLAWWLKVYSVISKGEMPPPESSELSDADRSRIVEWLSTEIQSAEKHRKTDGSRSSFRRLTRYEYNYALQDLFGVPWTFDRDLPAEVSEEDAFENNADSLHMSVKQLEAYRQLALDALRRVTVRGVRPNSVHWSIPMKAAFDREKRRIDREIESARQKFGDDQDKLAEEIERLEAGFETRPDRSHYLDTLTGLRPEIDWNYRQASYLFRPTDTVTPMPDPPLSLDTPAILGMDFAGTVEAVGEGVTDYSVGDEVYGCAGGLADLPGTLAEYIVADSNLIAHKAKNLSMREAAALPLVAITAYEGLQRAGIKQGQKVLVHGGSGGVGHVALQLAKHWGADVYSTGGGAKQLALIESLGATGINYKTEPVQQYVAKHTGGAGFDLVFDSVGDANLTNSFEAAALNGQVPRQCRCASLI